MRALKAFFLSRLLREKIMMVLFVALGAVMWIAGISGRVSHAWTENRSTRLELETQKQWLTNRESIEAAAMQAVKNLDPAQTLDETRLVGELNALARQYDLKFAADTPQTERTAQFAVHTVQITLARADWDVLKQFYAALSRRSPYIGISQFTLVSDRASNGALLNASLRVSSVEIVR